jgi:hypothetical protein
LAWSRQQADTATVEFSDATGDSTTWSSAPMASIPRFDCAVHVAPIEEGGRNIFHANYRPLLDPQ